MKYLAAATLFALSGPALAYEYQTTTSLGAWENGVEQYDDGELACVMRTYGDRGFLDFTHYQFSRDYTLFMSFPDNAETRHQEIVMYMRVDDLTTWKLEGAESSGTSLSFAFAGVPDEAFGRFMAQIQQGRRLYLLNEDGTVYDSWSLAGSAAAIARLDECGGYL